MTNEDIAKKLDIIDEKIEKSADLSISLSNIVIALTNKKTDKARAFVDDVDEVIEAITDLHFKYEETKE